MADIIYQNEISCRGFWKDDKSGLMEVISDNDPINVTINILNTGEAKVNCDHLMESCHLYICNMSIIKKIQGKSLSSCPYTSTLAIPNNKMEI